jgi:hypothetical protein
MKSKDQILLEEAYVRVASQKEDIEEKVSFKGALAAAAMGASAFTGGAHASDVGMSHDDLADRSMIAQTISPEMTTLAKAQDAYERVIEMIHADKKVVVPQELLKAIAADKSIAARCAHTMVLKGFELPDVLRKVVGDVDKQMKSSLMGP